MLKKIQSYISNFAKNTNIESNSKKSNLEILNLACAALLIETAFADKNFLEKEILSMKETLKRVFKMEEEIIDSLIEEAEQTVAESTSLYEHTRIINKFCDYESKLRLINGLWSVAFADQELDKYEEHLIRKISDLIHISHKDYIKEKRKAKEKL